MERWDQQNGLLHATSMSKMLILSMHGIASIAHQYYINKYTIVINIIPYILRDAILEAIAGIIGEPCFYLKWTLQTPQVPFK